MSVIIFIVALVFSVGFLLLIFSLVPMINQLRFLVMDLQRTSAEVRELSARMRQVTDKVDDKVEKVGDLLEKSQHTIQGISSFFKFFNVNVFKRSAGFMALIPAIKLGWTIVKKIKGGKHVE
jgi:predicted PurR-regulated permease PerM